MVIQCMQQTNSEGAVEWMVTDSGQRYLGSSIASKLSLQVSQISSHFPSSFKVSMTQFRLDSMIVHCAKFMRLFLHSNNGKTSHKLLIKDAGKFYVHPSVRIWAKMYTWRLCHISVVQISHSVAKFVISRAYQLPKACNSAYACRDWWLLKIEPGGGKGSC